MLLHSIWIVFGRSFDVFGAFLQRDIFSFPQKQPSFPWKLRDIHRKTPVLESLFNKVTGLQCNFIKMRPQQRCFPVDIAKFFRAPILKKICEWLLMFLIYWVIITICFFGNISLVNISLDEKPVFLFLLCFSFLTSRFSPIWIQGTERNYVSTRLAYGN